MKDFPNYLLHNKQEKVSSATAQKDEQIWQNTKKRRNFQASDVPSILKGLSRENHTDFTSIKEALRLKEQELLLFSSNNTVSQSFTSSVTETTVPKRTGLNRTFQQLMEENEHDHFILTKGDTHER